MGAAWAGAVSHPQGSSHQDPEFSDSHLPPSPTSASTTSFSLPNSFFGNLKFSLFF